MDRTFSKYRPVVHRGTGFVTSWIVRVTLAEGREIAFDDFEIAVRAVLKPAAWQRKDVDALLAAEFETLDERDRPSKNKARYRKLVETLQLRANHYQINDFQFSE